MPQNLLKNYPDLLEILHLNEGARIESLRRIFKRDIEDNPNFSFRGKKIRPLKSEEPAMQRTFRHLTTVESIKVSEDGSKYPARIFEMDRSRRLHWIRYHAEEKKKTDMEIFSVKDRKSGKDIFRTYIYDIKEQYAIVLEPQRSGMDYYILSAYYLNKQWATKAMKKRMKRKLPTVL